MSNTTVPAKEVRYNAEDRDFVYYLNGELVGYAPTRLQAESKLNELVYNLQARHNTTACDVPAEVLLTMQQEAETDEVTAALIQLERLAGVLETRAPRRRTTPLSYYSVQPYRTMWLHTTAA